MEMENHSEKDSIPKRSRYYQGLLDTPILEDGTTKIFLNMTSKNGSKELVSLLQYMKDTDIENPEILIKDKRILELDKIVAEVKESEEWEDTQMTIYDMGIAKGRIDSIFEILEEFGNLSENLRNEILAQTDMDILKKWFKLAAKVSSIDEFTQKMHE